ncbi:hypothetical protein L901_10825 [Agrobacterium sp. D14]|nr:hypothetical protein L901_10825 [Agrobacterium sp. D14]
MSFQGGLADAHKLPAYDGAKSLEGLTRSVLIVTNFLVEGKVRRRDFGNVPLTFNIVAHQPGSFQTVLEIAYATAVIGAPLASEIAGSVASNLLTDLIKTVFKRATGEEETSTPTRVAELDEDRSGDMAALVDAIEPGLRQGHTVINHGVMNITINQYGATGAPVARLNRQTKEYMWESVIDDQIRIKLFSIASFNANQGTGRAFDLEEGRSIPFDLTPEADRQTVDTLLTSISLYTRRRRLGDNLRSAVAIRYTCIRAADGRVKKIRILTARTEMSEF